MMTMMINSLLLMFVTSLTLPINIVDCTPAEFNGK